MRFSKSSNRCMHVDQFENKKSSDSIGQNNAKLCFSRTKNYRTLTPEMAAQSARKGIGDAAKLLSHSRFVC